VQLEISAEDIKRMVKAPGDYEGIARKFADATKRSASRARDSLGNFKACSASRSTSSP
jgi:hypothetical protein